MKSRIQALLLVAEAAIEFQRSGSNHAHVLIHRDLKLDNILVREMDGKLEVVLGDLGSSKHARLGMMSGNTVIYTPGYAPLEQRFPLLREPDRSVDAHALAVTIYEALAGLLPQTMLAREGLINSDGQRFGSLTRKMPRSPAEEAEYQTLRSLPLRSFVHPAPEAGLYAVDRAYLEKQLAQRLQTEVQNAEGMAAEICWKLLPTLNTAVALLPEDRKVELVDIYGGLESARQALEHATRSFSLVPAHPMHAGPTEESPGEPALPRPAPAAPVPGPQRAQAPASPPRPPPPAPEEGSWRIWVGGTVAGSSLIGLLILGISSSSYFDPPPPEAPELVLPDHPRPQGDPDPLPTALAPARGKLSVAVTGGEGVVYVDGRRKGSSGKSWELESGPHEVQVRNTAIGLDWKQTVRVPPGDTLKLVVDADAPPSAPAASAADPCDRYADGIRLLLAHKDDASATTTLDNGIGGLANRMTHTVPQGSHQILLSPQHPGLEPVVIQARVAGCTLELASTNGGCTVQIQPPQTGQIQASYSRKSSLRCGG